MSAVLRTDLPGVSVVRGKVRDVYGVGGEFDEPGGGGRLLLVATDRLSAFDWILPTGIPDKGRVLTQISRFWFDRLEAAGVPHHLISDDPAAVPLPHGVDAQELRGRSMVTRRCEVFPVECVVRGHLAGSGWKEYRESRSVCGVSLPAGLTNAAELPEPIFTPATKAEQGDHDENIDFDRMVDIIGRDDAEHLRDVSIRIFQEGRDFARERGVIIADTKFEFGRDEDGVIRVIDEVLTPDSSRFWPADEYDRAFAAGENPPSFDKQFVRDWLESTGWDKASEPPALPDDIAMRTRDKYVDAFERLTGRRFAAPGMEGGG